MFFLNVLPQDNGTLVGIGTGLNRHTVIDEYLSPMIYRGHGYMLQAGLNKQNDRFYNQLTLMYQRTKISPDINNHSFAIFYRGSFDWIRTYRLKGTTGKWSVYLGFHLLTGYQASSHNQWPNNGYSHCLAINLGPSMVLDYVPWTTDVHFYWEFSVPVLDYIVRPSLGSILSDGSIVRSRPDIWGVVTGGRLTTLHEYQRICSNLYVSLRDSPWFNVRVGYQWSFQNYTVNNHFQSAFHLLYISAYYRFKTG